jgi:hypothetical protein
LFDSGGGAADFGSAFPRNEANSPARTFTKLITPRQAESVVETNDVFWMLATTSGFHHFFGVREVCLSKLAFVKTEDKEDLNTKTLRGRQGEKCNRKPKVEENNTDVN